ncbi:hypothetical protein ABPG74_016749 [Tetrahymena malaccensis]
MGNQLHTKKQQDAGFFFIENLQESCYLYISKILFRQEYNLELKSLSDLQQQHDNKSLEIIQLDSTEQFYVIQLAKEEGDLSLCVKGLQQILQNQKQYLQKSDIRILPLYKHKYIILEKLDPTIEEYFISKQFAQTQIQGQISNKNLIEFLLDQAIAEQCTLYVNPENVRDLAENIHQDQTQIKRIHFKNIRSHKYVKKICERLNDIYLENPTLKSHIGSIIFDNSDTFDPKDNNYITQFNQTLQNFQHTQEFFLRNMDYGSRNKFLKNHFLPSLKLLKDIKTLDLSGNNINEFLLQQAQYSANQDDQINQEEYFQIEDDENKKEEIRDENHQQEGQEAQQNTFIFENLKNLCLNSNAFLTSQNMETILYSKALQNLEYLYLINNKIGQIQINDHRYALKKLTYLNLTANKINNSSSLAIFTSKSLRCIRKLILRSNDIQKIVENPDQCCLHNLEYLDLTKNKIESDQVYQIFCAPAFSHLKELILCMNSKITDFPNVTKENFSLQSLLHLKLSKNQISTKGYLQILECIPASLESLNLNSNKISLKAEDSQQIDQIFAEKKNYQSNLKILQMNNNMIIDATHILTYFKNLIVLDLSHNLISRLSSFKLDFIFKMDLSYNQLSSTEELFQQIHTSLFLNYLNLSNNQIISVLKHTYGPISIKRLDLSFNQISDISSQILFSCTNLPNLIQLNMSFNQISFPVLLNSLIKLEYLYLASNQINSQGLDSLLNQKFGNLKELDLYSNKIQGIKFKQNLEQNTPQLKKVILSKNLLDSFDVFKSLLIFRYIESLYLDGNLLAIPDESQQKIPEFIEQNKNLTINIQNFSYKDGLIDSIIAEGILKLLNKTKNINLSKNQIQTIQKLENEVLEKLELSENCLKSDSSQNIFTSNIPNLKFLNISKNQINSLFDTECIVSINLQKLEELDCSTNNICSKSCQALLTNSQFENLQKLNFRNNKVFLPVPQIQTEIKCPKLFQVILQNNNIETHAADFLFSSISASLKFLDLSYNKLNENIQLKEIGLQNLESLDLSGNNLGDQGCAKFLQCIELRQLSNLNLSMNKMRVVPNQFLLPSLWYLNISGNSSLGIYSKIEEYQSQNYFVKIIL